MVFGQIPEHGLISRQSKANSRGNQSMRLARLVLADNGESDLSRLEMLEPLTARDQFAIRRKNRGDANDVARGNSSVSQRELEARKPLAMFSDSLGKENFLRYERHVPGCGSSTRLSRKNLTRSEINKRTQLSQSLIELSRNGKRMQAKYFAEVTTYLVGSRLFSSWAAFSIAASASWGSIFQLLSAADETVFTRFR
jgi:hypothetical protein